MARGWLLRRTCRHGIAASAKPAGRTAVPLSRCRATAVIGWRAFLSFASAGPQISLSS
jgi:hypothetical protein